MDKEETKEGSQTCHLCGKVQCGQRLGRVKCCQCNRIFCLQQLARKFHIVAQANDPYFKCPRCTGICCCVCNCQKPPPHVHCKVYKVRQNKLKQQALLDNSYQRESLSPKPAPVPEPVPAAPMEDASFATRMFPQEPAVSPVRWEGMSNTWSDAQALWSMPPLDLPGSTDDWWILNSSKWRWLDAAESSFVGQLGPDILWHIKSKWAHFMLTHL